MEYIRSNMLWFLNYQKLLSSLKFHSYRHIIIRAIARKEEKAMFREGTFSLFDNRSEWRYCRDWEENKHDSQENRSMARQTEKQSKVQIDVFSANYSVPRWRHQPCHRSNAPSVLWPTFWLKHLKFLHLRHIHLSYNFLFLRDFINCKTFQWLTYWD